MIRGELLGEGGRVDGVPVVSAAFKRELALRSPRRAARRWLCLQTKVREDFLDGVPVLDGGNQLHA